MILSNDGENFLKQVEEEDGKCKLHAYDDGTGTWTIAWGCTKGVYKGMAIDEEQGEKMFLSEVQLCENAVACLIKAPISQGLYDILVSFFYNSGWGKCPKLLAAVNSGNNLKIRQTWMLYDHAYNERTGQVEEWPGLVKRRHEELAYWAKKDAQDSPKALVVTPPAVQAPQTMTKKEIVQASTKLTMGKRLQQVMGTLVGLLTLSNFTTVKANVIDLSPIIPLRDMFIIGFGVAILWGYIEYIKSKSVEDQKDGRYIPSGVADADTPN